MGKPETTNIAVLGPVNGLGERDDQGSYFKVVLTPAHSSRCEFIITGEQVSDLSQECHRIEIEGGP